MSGTVLAGSECPGPPLTSVGLRYSVLLMSANHQADFDRMEMTSASDSFRLYLHIAVTGAVGLGRRA